MVPTPGDPHDGSPAPGSAARAAETLAELGEIRGRTRRAGTISLTGVPLAAWGAAWLVGYAAFDLLPGRLALPIGSVLALAAVVTTFATRSREVRSGRETRMGRGWLIVLASSPLLVAIVSPIDRRAELIFLGALWGVSLMLLAVATGDLVLGLVGGATLLAGVGCRVAGGEHPLLVFGLVAGGAMASLGAWRGYRSWRR